VNNSNQPNDNQIITWKRCSNIVLSPQTTFFQIRLPKLQKKNTSHNIEQKLYWYLFSESTSMFDSWGEITM
jgi:hypothetical protein